MLRSVGARARDVRRIFATEGLVVAVAGWLLGVPLGYLLARGIVSLAGNAVGLDIAFVFPLSYVLIALIGTVTLALLIMLDAAAPRRPVQARRGDPLCVDHALTDAATRSWTAGCQHVERSDAMRTHRPSRSSAVNPRRGATRHTVRINPHNRPVLPGAVRARHRRPAAIAPGGMSALRAAREALTDEVRIFQIAMAVIAVAVADDAFVHPEPGTSAGDHLASGLIPIAVALAAALVFPRLRAGVRACIALAFGALALDAGIVDGVRHIVINTISGDDVTACLSARRRSRPCRARRADPVAHTPTGRIPPPPLRPPLARRSCSPRSSCSSSSCRSGWRSSRHTSHARRCLPPNSARPTVR